LEIGGGNGFHASILDFWGCNVTSFDLKERKAKKEHFRQESINMSERRQRDKLASRIILLLGIILAIAISPKLFSNSISSAAASKPKVLMFTQIDIYYLRDTVQYWGERVGVNGFLLSYIAEWYYNKDELNRNLAVLSEVNRIGAQYGVDSNFIKVAIGYYKLPLWTDDNAWAPVLENFRNIAAFCKQSGTKGIAIDTEPYNAVLYAPKAERFKGIDRSLLKSKIFQRGREIALALTQEYPEMELMVLLEGAFYWFHPEQGVAPGAYELWMDFYDGLASVRNKTGIVIAGERTYSVLNRAQMIDIYNKIDQTMLTYAKDAAYWKEKGSIALGMWPLGKEYYDKSARYSPNEFKSQFQNAVALSPRYVWIYDHGTAWFQLKNGEEEKYIKNGRSIWEKRYQMLPTNPNIDEFHTVLRNYQKDISK
jgi:muramidase (phage lysozyme)